MSDVQNHYPHKNTYPFYLIGGRLTQYINLLFYSLSKIPPPLLAITEKNIERVGNILQQHESITRIVGCCLISPLITNPLDTVIARIQTQEPLPLNLFHYYKGIYLAYFNTFIKVGLPMMFIPLFHEKYLKYYPNAPWPMQVFLSATAASIVENAITGPISYLRTLQQIYGKTLAQLLAEMDAQHSIKSLYKGSATMTLRDTLFWSTFYSVEKTLHRYDDAQEFAHINTAFKKGLIGFIAGISASTVSLPLDVIGKNIRISKNYPRIYDTINRLYQKHGIAFFYKGYLITTLRMSLVGLLFGLGTHYMPALFNAMSQVNERHSEAQSENKHRFFSTSINASVLKPVSKEQRLMPSIPHAKKQTVSKLFHTMNNLPQGTPPNTYLKNSISKR
jgi:hypothetical protein